MKTIITAVFKQETNRYAPGLSDVKAFENRRYFFGEEAVRAYFKGTKSEMGGFFDVLDAEDDFHLVIVLAANASPGPVVAQDVWDTVTRSLLDAIDQTPQVDGILLALHGAMVTENYEDGEGELLERLREKVGPDLPIIASADLHANVTQKMMDHLTALFPYDYYPHTDLYEAGVRAASCMRDTLHGRIRPSMAWRKLDMIFPYVPTAHPPFIPLLQEAQSYRGKEDFIGVSICHGFFTSDIYEQGACVLAITDNAPEKAQRCADALACKVFDARESLRRRFYTLEDGVKAALESETKTVVIADVADNPGAGSSADSVSVLKAFIDAKAKDVALAYICDPETAEQAATAGAGATISVHLGGKIAPEVTGGPLACKAYVKTITDGFFRNRDKMGQGMIQKLGKTALLVIEDIFVIVGSVAMQPWDLEIYRHVGIQPQDMKILVTKSTAHYRHSFGTLTDTFIEIDAPALSPMDLAMLPLAHSRRPIWPLDPVEKPY